MRFYDNKERFFISSVISLLSLLLLVTSSASGNTLLRMQTDLGAIDIEVFDSTFQTRENFLNYVNDGDYAGTFIHRSVPGFVIQGGGFIFDGPVGSFFAGGVTKIPVDPPVVNEPGLLNLRGTIAMARVPGEVNSATSQWYVNLIDNPALDFVDEGFTVFAKVDDDDMVVVDAIAGLQRCEDFLVPSDDCGDNKQTPFVDFNQLASNKTLVNVNYIGIDSDEDGAIDKIEDAAPNSGDGNNDGIADSDQQHIASFPWSSGEYIVMESPLANPLQSLNILGETFALANKETTEGVIVENDFFYGYAGFDLPVSPGLNPVAVTITLPPGRQANKYFNFGPTLVNPDPHWYEFNYDSVTGTGAVFEDNIVTLYFIDGERGDDSPGLADGEITTLGGPALNDNLDDDAYLNDVEDAGPNDGDGNDDGIPDSLQRHVGTTVDFFGSYITVETDPPTLKVDSLQSGIGLDVLLNPDAAEFVSGRNFPHGFISFVVTDMVPGGSVDVKLYLAEGSRPVSYLKYGPTPGNPVDHLYEFLYDGETGAEFDDNVITLHFVDGKRGDSDRLINGVVFDPGAPAVSAPATSSDSSGCSLGRPGTGPWHGGDWWLLLTALAIFRLRRVVAPSAHQHLVGQVHEAPVPRCG